MTDIDEKTLRHEILFSTGAVIKVEFERIKVRKRRIRVDLGR